MTVARVYAGLRRLVPLVCVVAVAAGGVLVPSPVSARSGGSVAAPGPRQKDPVVAVRQVEPATAKRPAALKRWRPEPAVWPGRAAVEVALPAVSSAAAGTGALVRAGELPVWVGAVPAAPGDGVSKVRVQLVGTEVAGTGKAGGAAAEKALVLRISRADGVSAAGRVRVTVNYRSFVSAFGGDWASRLRLWRVPECAAGGVQASSCRMGELPSVVDAGKGTATALVDVAGAGAAGQETSGSTGSSGSLVVLAASSSGATGNFGATSLSPSASWGAGGNSGDFTWSYPLRIPAGLGGPQPNVVLGYSSAGVDGRMASANGQPSWIGEGFDWHPGFIERRYRTCAQDMGAGANTAVKTGDLCWVTDNAVLSLAGHAGELIKDGADPDRWHLRDDDGTRVERRTGAANGDNDGEWWVATTTDGTQYWFGGRAGSASTLTVPVFGNHAGEPCHQAAFAASSCLQGYRWQLDHVVDAHGNTMRIGYAKETNRYARNLTLSDSAVYDRAGYPERIEYGTRGMDDAPGMRVVFTAADRCLADCGVKDAAHWPDVPFDQECGASPCGVGQVAPTFWTTKRLARVVTQVWDAGTSSWRDVESWGLTHAFPDPDDRGAGDSVGPVLWLERISHRGVGTSAGSAVTLPDVVFTGAVLANRVDTAGDQFPAMNRYRVTGITTETGGTIGVTYGPADCVAGSRMPDKNNLQDNGLRCYPVKWTPPGYTEPIDDFFHKYVVTQVAQAEGIGSSPRVVTRYDYGGAPAWHYTDDDGLVEPQYKTWSVWRGYGSVTATSGEAGARTQVETRYFRGMHGDKLPSGTRSVALPAIAVGDVPAAADEDAFAGLVRETITRDVTTGGEVTATVYEPWQSDPTASRTVNESTVHARIVGTAATHTRTTRDGVRAPRTTTRTTRFDSYGMPTWAEDAGDDEVAGDETCSLTEYTRNTTLWLVDSVARRRSFALDCATAKARVDADSVAEGEVISDVRTSYDEQAWNTAPVKGDVTLVESAGAVKDGQVVFVTASTATYDAYGRVVSATDARGATTSTAYTPASGGPVTQTRVTGPLGWVTTTSVDPAWGVPVTVTDPNGRVSDLVYDGLGRLSAAWLPGNDKATNPDKPTISHSYQIRGSGPVVVTTRRLNPAGAYITAYSLYDGLLRPRQTQSPDAAGAADRVVVTDTFYDAAGRAYKTHDPYLAPVAPSATLVQPTEDVPSSEVTEYDGAGRTKAIVHLVDQAPASPGGTDERWRTVYGYGGDRDDVTPPTGGTTTSTVKNAAGQVVEMRQYQPGIAAGSSTGFVKTSYEYDRKGQLATITDATGKKWRYTYDLRGRLTVSDDPDVGTVKRTYSPAGDLLSQTDNAGMTTAYTYDVVGRQTSMRDDSATGPKRAEWMYDTLADGTSVKGQLAKSVRFVGKEEYARTVDGYTVDYQPTSVTYTIPSEQTGLSGTYSYARTYYPDGSPRTTRLPAMGNLPLEEVSFGYDALGLPTTLSTTLGGKYVIGTGYTSFSEPTKVKLQNNGGNTVDLVRTYETDTRRLQQIWTTRQTTPTAVADMRLSYDPAGNVTRLSDLTSGDHQCFKSDFLRRLTEAWTQPIEECAVQPSSAVVGGLTPYWHTYSYDDIGNRTKLVKHGTASGDVTTTYTVPAEAHQVSATSTSDSSGTRTTSHTYDAAGNMKTRTTPGGTQTMTWDREGHLTTTQDSTGTTRYIYDADGNRLIRQDPSGKTLYLPDQELRYSTATGGKTAVRYYTYAGQTIATRTTDQATGVKWLSSDHHGTTGIVIGNTPSQAVAKRRQTPFGETRDVTGIWPSGMTRGFVGGTEDNTGLTHLGAREYDPTLGRFISVDPFMDIHDSQQMNGYSYADNNPLTFSDPDGLIPRSCPDGVCTGGGTGANQNRANNPAWYDPPNTGFKGGPCGARPCPPADNPAYGPQGARPRGDNLLPMGGTCGARACQEYELAPMGWDQQTVEWTCSDDIVCDWFLGDAERCLSDPSLSWDCVSAGIGVIPGGKLLSGAGKLGRRLLKLEKKADNCLLNSFVPDTMVLMADGSHKRIDQVQVGDEVLATDPETGQTGPREVTALISGDGAKNLVQITVSTGRDGVAGVLTATDGHPFWVPELRAWVTAAELRVGMLLQTSAGTYVQVTGVKRWTARQRVHNLSVEGLHTYYVLAGDAPVLVHNDGDDPTSFGNHYPEDKPGWSRVFSPETLAQRTGNYQYVVLESGELVIGKGDGHVTLANGQRVSAAGEVRIKSGRITEINNLSGHYRPYGANAASAAESAFNAAGFDATGKYVEHPFPRPSC